jgi:hypothetical protein
MESSVAFPAEKQAMKKIECALISAGNKFGNVWTAS